jgi:phosphopantetheinyl transferase
MLTIILCLWRIVTNRQPFEIRPSRSDGEFNTEYCGLLREQRAEGFFHCWTRKEAYINATGEGLSLPLNRFQVSLEKQARLVQIVGADGEAPDWSLIDLKPVSECVGALALPRLDLLLRTLWLCFNVD